MALKIKIRESNLNNVFVPLANPAMSFMDAFKIVKYKYKAVFDYLEDK